MLLTVVVFIILLGVLVLVHEWGHFIVARRFGVRVDEFAFGFPPRVASITRRGTRYAVNLIPIGGYVKIHGEGGENAGDPTSFSSRPLAQRLAIIAAGVAMNVVLAWALFTAGHAIGFPTVLAGDEPTANATVTIIGVTPGSPAAEAGVQFGDVILGLGSAAGETLITTIDQVQSLISSQRGGAVAIRIMRGSAVLKITAVPRRDPPPGEGALGIAMARVGVVRSPWWRAPRDGIKTTANAVLAIGAALGRTVRALVSQGQVSPEISGPVGIFAFANETRRLGFTYLIELAGILSVNLALLNILPIPALDGGRILFLFLEGVRGVRVSERLEQAIHTAGFAFLLALMALITYRDLVRVF